MEKLYLFFLDKLIVRINANLTLEKWINNNHSGQQTITLNAASPSWNQPSGYIEFIAIADSLNLMNKNVKFNISFQIITLQSKQQMLHMQALMIKPLMIES